MQRFAPFRTALTELLMAVTLTGSVLAGPLANTTAPHERGDHASALRVLRSLANEGDGIAQFNLGVAYGNGEGVRQDYAEAMKWYRKAVDQGVADAQTGLGHLYAFGEGVPQDYAEAARWYRKAADQGSVQAQIERAWRRRAAELWRGSDVVSAGRRSR
jgi:TPR repeat protein